MSAGKSFGTSRKLGISADVEVPIVRTGKPHVYTVLTTTRPVSALTEGRLTAVIHLGAIEKTDAEPTAQQGPTFEQRADRANGDEAALRYIYAQAEQAGAGSDTLGYIRSKAEQEPTE